MSDPEIARRCSACGVSLRQRALYCPQCGRRVGDETTAETADTAPTEALHPISSSQTAPTEALHPPSSSQTAPTQALHPLQQPSGLTGVADNVRERVEKIRHVSSVVIDQAAYDPSLRFLLVAAALFLLFIILLVLSKVLG